MGSCTALSVYLTTLLLGRLGDKWRQFAWCSKACFKGKIGSVDKHCLLDNDLFVCVEVLRPSQPMQSCTCRVWSVYLTTLLLGRLSPLSG